jgi:hypothetical protein
MTEGTKPSIKEVNEWRTLFISGELQLKEPVVENNQPPHQKTQATHSTSDVLDEKEFFDYLQYKCDWRLEQEDSRTYEIYLILFTFQ